jgi:hypothetical protein
LATLGTLCEGSQMNLILRAHESVNDPVWSVIYLLIVLLMGTGFYILYIMKNAYYELDHGTDDTT